MNIELKKISYSRQLSEETSAYTAQVWVDGVHICDVSNHGQGGCDMQHPAKGKTHKDVEALNDAIKAERGEEDSSLLVDGKPFRMQIDLEAVCGELLDKHLMEKDLKRALKSKVLFQQDGKLYEIKIPRGTLQPAAFIQAVKQKKNIEKTLNEMPILEALAIYQGSAA